MVAVTILAGAALAGALCTGTVAGAAYYYQRKGERDSDLEDLVVIDETDDLGGHKLAFSPPAVSGSVLDYFRVTRHLQRGRKLAKKGYVRWYKLDSTLQRPVWVKPEQDGSGMPKYTENGQPYYFPKDSMVTDERTGAWVAVHRDGEADPVNLRDPAYPGIETDLVERLINLEIEQEPPGFLSQFNLSQQALLWGGMAVLFVLYAAYRYMG